MKIKDIEGKTIERTKLFDWDDKLGLVFTDGDHVVLATSIGYSDTIDIQVRLCESENEEKALGLITQDEFERKRRTRESIELIEREDREAMEYLRLKAKFEGGQDA